MEKITNKKKIWHVPHTYVIITIFIIFMAIMTYIVPAGTYERVLDSVTGREVVDPDSFAYAEQQPVSILQILTSVTYGMQSVADVVFFIFIIGGAMEIIQATGAIKRGVTSLAKKESSGRFFIPIFAFVFALGGATFGVSDEILIFAPIGVAIAHALGYDALTGLAAIALGAAVGFNAGFLNPFSVGIAQSISELPLYSGMTFRLIIFAIMFVVTIWYIMRYAKKVKADPSLSIVKDCLCELEREDYDPMREATMTKRDKFVLITLLLGISFMVYGVFVWEWYIDEMAGIFVGLGVLCGIIGGLAPSHLASSFVDGAKEMTFGALLAGLAKAILVIMQDGLILDTIIHALVNALLAFPSVIAVIGMYIIQIILNFFLPASTGQAAAVMPIMIPIADIVGITRQTAVMAFQFGDGFSNSIIPTSSVLMSYLAVTRIPYEKWVKFIWPLMLIWIGLGAIFLIIAQMIEYGPF